MANPKVKTAFLGVRYREHPTRKNGVRADRCFFVRYKLNAKDKEEMAGWASEGMTAEKAFNLLAILRESTRAGEGPQTLADMKAIKEAKTIALQNQENVASGATMTFFKFWNSEYLPLAESSKKASSMISENFLFKKWIEPAIGNTPLQNITTSMIENIMIKMQKQGKSASSIRYVLAVISQVWNHANLRDYVRGDNPTRKIKKPRVDNRRVRFLTPNEATQLLTTLAKRSVDVHDSALLSLFAGLRAGEIHALTWGDIDFEQGTISIRDPKNTHSRHAHMTQEVKNMLKGRYMEQFKTAFVFPARGGGQRMYVPDTFERTVRELGFNNSGELDCEGKPIEVSDARQRVVFHTLRHTFASWLAQAGTPIFTLAQLMGHTDMKMTQRYSHLAPDNVKAATLVLQGMLGAE